MPKRVKKRKTDRNDAVLLLRLMQKNNFPRVWVPSPENRDLRQLLGHRHRLVQMRTWIMYQLQALAMNEGYRWKKKLFGEQRTSTVRKAVWPIDLPKLSHIVAFPRPVHARADGGTFRV